MYNWKRVSMFQRENNQEREREREGFDPSLTRTRPEPASLTRTDLPNPATLSAVLGTNSKLGRRPSYPRGPRRRKPTRTPAIWAWKLRPRPIFAAVDPARFLERHHLELVPHISSNKFRPTKIIGDTGKSPNDHQKVSDLWSFDPPLPPLVGGHRRHHWTHQGRN